MNIKNRIFSGVMAFVFAFAAMSSLADVNYVDVTLGDDSNDGMSWATAKETIQAAIDATAEGGTVWVTNGTYEVGGTAATGSTQTNRVYISRSITVRSVNGPNVTTILGAAGSNGSNDVDSIRGVYLTTNASLVGFTVSGGYTIPAGDYPVWAAPGAGVHLSEGAVISNCTIRGNSTLAAGGGVYLKNSGFVTHSTIQGNHAKSGGGGAFLNYGGMMSDCVVSGNTESWNGGGGASIEGQGMINNSTFYGNQSGTGGGIKAGGQMVGEVVVNNCLVYDNLSTGGGGGISGDQALIVNCTIVGNEAQDTESGGGGFGESMMGGSSLYNCIIWNNTAPTNSDFHLLSYGGEWDQSVVSNVCASSGVTSGVDECITNHPSFVDSAASNYQLQATSPCVNAGVHEMQPNPWDPESQISVTDLSATDLAGNLRINNSTVDIGAYEQIAALSSYTITTTAGANGSMSPLNPSVYQGADQIVSIQPATGYRIDTLTVDGNSVTPTTSHMFMNVHAAHTIAATFVVDPHTLSISSGAGGGSYTNAASILISAHPATSGSVFSHWTAAPSEYINRLANPSSATTTFTMPQANVALTAVYQGVIEVQQVTVAQRPGTKLVDISYDVFSGATNTVSVSLSVSNATTAVSATTLSGDVGSGISTGTGQSILWDMGADWNGQVADLLFEVVASAGSFLSYPDSNEHSVDSRNYTLTVASRANGTLNGVSSRGHYSVSKSSGAVKPYPNQDTKAYKHSDHKDRSFSSYASTSAGSHYMWEFQPGSLQGNAAGLPAVSMFSMAPGACTGYASIQVDPEAGTLRASAAAKNRGGPAHWIDSDGDSRDYSIYNTWGVGEASGGTHRLYEVTGSAPFNMTVDLNYSGDLESEKGSLAGHSAITLITLVKDKEAYFNYIGKQQEMNWEMASDVVGDPNAYDWIFGGMDQEVAEFLLQESYGNEFGVDQENNATIPGNRSYSVWVHPGDLILVDNLISVSAVTMNPVKILGSARRARSDDFTITSEVGVEAGSNGGLSKYAYLGAESIGDPLPAVGVYSNYCWMSVITCSVDSVEGHISSGWTGTGSVPTSGAALNTGAITLSEPESSIIWNWDFEGYALTVEDGGEGSGFYTNGAVAFISADPDGFYYWNGDHADDLADPYAAATSLRMPAESTALTPIYSPSNIYVDASMPHDLHDGRTWETAKKTIQAAVDLVAADGTVWVTNGIYSTGGAIAPAGMRSNRVCITRSMTVRSINGADVTTIVGGGLRTVYMTNGCALAGFTLTDGSASNNSNGNGGGLWLTADCMASSCTISNNRADLLGGGVYLSAGGTLNNCILRGNGADWQGGGLYLTGGTVNNCLVVDNESPNGGGAYLTAGELNNCTVVTNMASSGAGGVALNGGGAVNNCIIWDNGYYYGAPVFDLSNSKGTVRNTCSSDGVISGMDGAITNSPLFVDAANGNFQLQPNSPCLDQGNNTYAPVANGLGGQSRVINGTVDMGAYERFLTELDTDVDGIPDWWELRHFGGVSNAPALQLSSNGVDTVQAAFIAGLDPKNPESRFVTQIVQIPGKNPFINWPTARGRVYSVYWAPNLSTGFTLRKANIPWTRDGFSDDENETDLTGFYQIKVQLKN